jgi:hypothetical protein
MISTHDHEPPHVHCHKAGTTVLIDIETGNIRKNCGMNKKQVRNAVALVHDNKAKLLQEWRKVLP